MPESRKDAKPLLLQIRMMLAKSVDTYFENKNKVKTEEILCIQTLVLDM